MKVYDFHGFPDLRCSFAELVETWSVHCHGNSDCDCRNEFKIWCTDLKIWKNGSGGAPAPRRIFWGGGGVGMPAEGGPARHAFGPPAGPNLLIKSALEVVSE